MSGISQPHRQGVCDTCGRVLTMLSEREDPTKPVRIACPGADCDGGACCEWALYGYWVVFEREDLEGNELPDFHVGPFPSLAASTYALNESLLIEAIATDTKRDFKQDFTVLEVNAPETPYVPELDGDNITVIDPHDPYHDPYTNEGASA